MECLFWSTLTFVKVMGKTKMKVHRTSWSWVRCNQRAEKDIGREEKVPHSLMGQPRHDIRDILGRPRYHFFYFQAQIPPKRPNRGLEERPGFSSGNWMNGDLDISLNSKIKKKECAISWVILTHDLRIFYVSRFWS